MANNTRFSLPIGQMHRETRYGIFFTNQTLGGSKRGRLEAAKKDNKERFEKMLDVFIERNKEPLPEHETCPNFNQDDLSCVLCGYDEWKFKKCGEKKK